MVLPVIDEIEIQHIKAWGDTPQNTGKNEKLYIL